MPVTVGHNLTATTPDDPGYEIRPSHWNDTHAVTLAINATEISGLFSNKNGVSFGLDGTNITASVNAAGGGLTNINVSGGTTSNNLSNLVFSNDNGVSFGLNGSTITASVNAAGGGLTNINVSAGTTSQNLSAVTFSDANGVSFGLNGSVITGTVKTDYQSSNANYLTSQSNQALSGSNGSFAFQTATFGNLNGLSFYTSNGSMVGSYTVPTVPTSYVSQVNGSSGALSLAVGSSLSASTNGSTITFGLASNITTALQSAGNYLTTARASNDAIGLNTAQSNVTWTVNSSGLSLDARGYAGTGTSATNASVTLNSNGLAISVAAGGGVNPVASASNGSFSFTTLAFSNANNVTFGTSAGSIITASVAAPGAAAEQNAINLLGANTAGNTTATGSTLGLSGLNVTLSGTNNSQIVISAPASSSLVGVLPIGISTNGSTISVSLAPASVYVPYPLGNNTSFSSLGQNSLYMQFCIPFEQVSMTHIEILGRGSFVSSTNSQVYRQTISYGIYSQGSGASTSLMSQIGSSSIGMSVSYNSNTAYGYTLGQGATSITSSSGGTGLASHLSGPFNYFMPFATVLDPNVKYGIAVNISSATTGSTAAMRFAPLVMTVMNSLSYAKLQPGALTAPATSNYDDWEMAVGSVTTGALPSSIAFNAMSIAVSRQRLYVQLEGV